jgi:hypothetical protein
MIEKKYVEIRFRLPIEDFKEYEIEANKANELGYDVSPTAQIRAESIKQSKIKRQNRQKLESIYKQPSVMDVFEGL